jgi:hypothetical protein
MPPSIAAGLEGGPPSRRPHPVPVGRGRRGLIPLALLVLSYFTLGTPMLESLGYRYSVPANSFLERFHPATYVVLFMLLSTMLSRRGIDGLLRQVRLAWPAAQMAGIALLCAVALTLSAGNTGLSYFVDTFASPAIVAVLLVGIPAERQALAFRLAIACLAMNAAIAMIEAFARSALIGAPYSGEFFRATALLGHPLNNSLITAPAILLLIGSPSRIAGRILAILVLIGGLLAFSGRGAVLTTFVFACLGFMAEIAHAVVTGRLRITAMRAYMALMLLVPVFVVIVILTTNIGDRLWTLLYFDQSANERVAVFSIFRDVPSDWMWFGSSSDQIESLVAAQLDIAGIENYWIYLLLQLGILKFVPFALAFLWFLRWLARGRGLYVTLAVLDFLAVSSTNNSLSSKTTAVGALVVMAIGAGAQRELATSKSPRRATATRSRLSASTVAAWRLPPNQID